MSLSTALALSVAAYIAIVVLAGIAGARLGTWHANFLDSRRKKERKELA